MKVNLAIDIGASSGRHIVSYEESNKIVMKEVYRFTNGVTKKGEGYIWDIEALLSNIIKGIEIAGNSYEVATIGVDTWGVDYALLDENDSLIGDIFAYRDDRTDKTVPLVHEIIPFEDLYKISGVQFLKINTIYQLYHDKINGKLENAKSFLMIPDYINFVLTGVKANEYTNASTTGMLCGDTNTWSTEIIEKLDLPKHLFKELVQPSSIVGECKYLKGAMVVNVPSHDTASAYEAAKTSDSIILSSGTWSLMGVKIPNCNRTKESLSLNFSNEGGVGYIRYLKNIMGMWLINSVKNEFKQKYNKDYSFVEIVNSARQSKSTNIVDVTEDRFLAPESMIDQFEETEIGDIASVIYRSLAVCYTKTIEEIEGVTGKKYSSIEIVGGGVNNEYLNELTAKYSGREIIKGEVEATALGNIKSQIRSLK